MLARLPWPSAVCGLAVFLAGCGPSQSGPPAGANNPQAGGQIDPTGATTDEDSKWADHTQHLPFIIGYEKGLAEAKARNKPMMLFVTTTWCGWCKKLAEENFNDSTVKKLLDNFVLVIVDGDTEPDALTKLGATEGFPHLIFQSNSGEKLGEHVGYLPLADFKKVVEGALAKAGNA
ncbi:MAG TPA: thioredoxin family protein [Pirellulales bacterium]|nr:thioredoxin family protein [Pirellulales bacterium]